MAHLKPLPPESTPELKEDFAIFERILGFVPNSLLTMQRIPGMVKGFGELTKAVMNPEGTVDLGLMRLIAHFSSRAAGCQYCEAHSLVAAKIHGVSQDKLDAIWEYKESPLYSDAERVGLDFALAAGDYFVGFRNPTGSGGTNYWSTSDGGQAPDTPGFFTFGGFGGVFEAEGENFDHAFELESGIPEPASLSLILLGAVAVVRRRRKRA